MLTACGPGDEVETAGCSRGVMEGDGPRPCPAGHAVARRRVVKQMQVARQVIAGALALGLLTVVSSLPVAAHAPEITRNTSFSYTVADSLADFANDPSSYEVDCGAFKVIATFDVTRSVTTWPDRELRHVTYTGSFANASDPSKMI